MSAIHTSILKASCSYWQPHRLAPCIETIHHASLPAAFKVDLPFLQSLVGLQQLYLETHPAPALQNASLPRKIKWTRIPYHSRCQLQCNNGRKSTTVKHLLISSRSILFTKHTLLLPMAASLAASVCPSTAHTLTLYISLPFSCIITLPLGLATLCSAKHCRKSGSLGGNPDRTCAITDSKTQPKSHAVKTHGMRDISDNTSLEIHQALQVSRWPHLEARSTLQQRCS